MEIRIRLPIRILTCADDIALVNTAQKDLQKFIDCLVKYSAEVGVYVNVSKTECMSTDQNINPHLTINSKIIKQVKTFIYLGHKLSSDNNGTPAVKHRIGLG